MDRPEILHLSILEEPGALDLVLSLLHLTRALISVRFLAPAST